MKNSIILIFLFAASTLIAQSRYELSRTAQTLEDAEGRRASSARQTRSADAPEDSALRKTPAGPASKRTELFYLKLFHENPTVPLALASVSPSTYSWFILQELKEGEPGLLEIKAAWLKIDALYHQYQPLNK